MNDTWDSADIDRAIADLKAAGWVSKTHTIWKHPNGKLYIGPAGAWRVMQREKGEK